MYGLQVPEIQSVLLLLGYSPQEIERLEVLLERLRPQKERAYAHYMRLEHENAILPTLEDIDVVCDVRPFFEDYAYPIPESEIATRHTKLLGFSYMVLTPMFDVGRMNHR